MPKIKSFAERQKEWEEETKSKAQHEAEAKAKAKELARKKAIERKRQNEAEWKKENSKVIQLRMANSSGLYDVIAKAAKTEGTPISGYVRNAVVEKLQREGYLAAKSDAE